MSLTPWRSKVIKDCFLIIILFGFLSFLWLSTRDERDEEPPVSRETVIRNFESYYDSEMKSIEDEYEDEEFSTVYENKEENAEKAQETKVPSGKLFPQNPLLSHFRRRIG